MVKVLVIAIIAAIFISITGFAATFGQTETITSPQVPRLHALVVGHYQDASGQSPLPYNGAYVDDPMSDGLGVRYVVGHDVDNIFHWTHQLVDGDTVQDSWACSQTGPCGYTVFRVIDQHRFWDSSTRFPPIPVGTYMQLQTCEDTFPNGTGYGQSRYDDIVSLELVQSVRTR